MNCVRSLGHCFCQSKHVYIMQWMYITVGAVTASCLLELLTKIWSGQPPWGPFLCRCCTWMTLEEKKILSLNVLKVWTFHSNSFNELITKITCHSVRLLVRRIFAGFQLIYRIPSPPLLLRAHGISHSRAGSDGFEMQSCVVAHVHVKAGMLTCQGMEMHDRMNVHF